VKMGRLIWLFRFVIGLNLGGTAFSFGNFNQGKVLLMFCVEVIRLTHQGFCCFPRVMNKKNKFVTNQGMVTMGKKEDGPAFSRTRDTMPASVANTTRIC